MVNDNMKITVSNDGFEYEVEFGKIYKNRNCCNRGMMSVRIKARHSPEIQFKGFSKNNDMENAKLKFLTRGYFCPLCGRSLKVESKFNIDTEFYDWRNATKAIDEAIRKAWLSLHK